MENNKKLITTAIAYSNGEPHIGNAFEFIITDVYNRYLLSLQEKDTFFTTGMDEHGSKIFKAAQDNNISPQVFTDRISEIFMDLDKRLNINYNQFTRTTNSKHITLAKNIWEELSSNGDLKKKHYKAKYCIGCESFKNDSELMDGVCPDHNASLKIIDEENYFFLISKYKDIIKEKIQKNIIRIYPEYRKLEILNLIDNSEDVSFSRPTDKVIWGIAVPGDETQLMYVWCDALVSYITNDYIDGFDNNYKERFVGATHIIGKDILRFHAIIWPAILLALGFRLENEGDINIITHGHITSGGQKMSKSIGNVINPKEVLDELENKNLCAKDIEGNSLAGDALRFILLHEIPTLGDGDITMEQIKNIYNAHLANGLGNTVSRIMKIAEENNNDLIDFRINNNFINPYDSYEIHNTHHDVFHTNKEKIGSFDIKMYLEKITEIISSLEKMIQVEEVYKLIKENKEQAIIKLSNQIAILESISFGLKEIMPITSQAIINLIRENKKPENPLFKRWL